MNNTYIVQDGDTILSIAKLYGVRVIDLIIENNLEDDYFIAPGTELKIPMNTKSSFSYYTVKKGDTLYSIASMYNISFNDLEQINGLENPNYLYVGQRLLVPNKNIKVYITKPSDTLNSVSSYIGVSPEEILLYNDKLYLLPGQLIAYSVNENEQI